MSRIAALLVVFASACYDPNVRDCTVTCAGTGNECETGQVCGADHYCAAPAVADHCADVPSPDGRSPVDAAPPADAPRPDAPPPRPDASIPLVALHLHDDGMGVISIVGTGVSCDSQNAVQHGDCTYMVPANASITLHASGEANQHFDHWNSTVCSGMTATCTFTPVTATDVHAAFKKDD